MTITEKAPYRKELAQIREARKLASTAALPSHNDIQHLTVNPSLQIVATPWRGLADQFERKSAARPRPEPGEEMVMVWQSPHDRRIHTEAALPVDLLALKIVVEERERRIAADEAKVTVGVVDNAIRHAVKRGLLLSPPSRIHRPRSFHCTVDDERSLSATVFTLQWHITQQCDLNCLHCYDRSARQDVELGAGLRILDQLRDFCVSHHVRGQVSFSGGNPLLHPDFMSLYLAAADRGLATVILGNPTSTRQLAKIVAIQMPAYFQVSLEGLEQQNDTIRGTGHFRRTLEFLEIMTELGIPNEVMLTLTRDNLSQVLPLGELLRNRTGSFTFNRLALFGGGANLALPGREEYAAFLRDYLAAMRDNPVLALKDSLFNIVLEKENRQLFDGCAGFGCGAAFNFVALLADGAVHACRKFPSPIGSISQQSLADIYHGESASAYREGSASCRDCRLRAVCRGCPAITASLGGDPAHDRDPFCFRE
ncbi:MAG: thio(seleno)oxazole modification radical SAM maturase SbtM [Geobacteraceae bacterium]|nr:thio(seleno)oxazole modification radical SAM maturase SbtM [Geobacteraceae bacterium]